MGKCLSLESLTRRMAIGLASGLILLARSPQYLAQGGPGDERAIAKAVFAHQVTEQRRVEDSTVSPVDLELDPRRLQWDAVVSDPSSSWISSWVRFDGHHPRSVVDEILQHAGAARACEPAFPDKPCHSKAGEAVIVAMSAPRFATADSAHVRVVLFWGSHHWAIMNSLAFYLVTLRRSAQGWAVVSEELIFET